MVDRRASMRQVAEHANVAMSSVSRVLSGHPDVSEKMKQRVWASVAELGYTPDLLAQSLRSGQTLTVGLVAANIANPLLAEIAKGAESVLRGGGYSLLLSDSESDPRLDETYLRLFERRRVDGLVLMLASETHEPTSDFLRSTSTPFVLVDREIDGLGSARAVLSDHRSGMRDAVSHLLDLGHRRIALITGLMELRASRERAAGLHQAFLERAVDDDSTVVSGPYSSDHGSESTRMLMSGPDAPTAIVVGGNQILIGVLGALRDLGLRPGSDVSLVTCDDTPLTRLLDPPIASISRDNARLGRSAAEMLIAAMTESATSPSRVLLPTSYRPTTSCTVVAVPKDPASA